MEEKVDMILLFSGGRDSSVLLHLAKNMGKNVLCLLFDYEQIHVEELNFAKNMCSKMDVLFYVQKLNIPIKSNLTDDVKTYEGVSPFHVPSRNLIFLSIAASIAESMDIPLIWYGANYEDRENQFPDCYQEWVFRLNSLLAINGSMNIRVEAPLLGMSKEVIRNLQTIYRINDNEIFSGYGK